MALLLTNNRKGFSIVEALLSVALFSLLASIFVSAYLYGEEASLLSGNRTQAVRIAEEGLEIVRNIRNDSFSSLSAGTYGLATSSNTWDFSGSSDTVGDFTREITIESVDAQRFDVTSNVTWTQNLQRNGSVTLSTRLTDWQETAGSAFCTNQASYLTIDTSGAALTAGNRQLSGIFTGNSNTECAIRVSSVSVTWTDITRRIQQVRTIATPVWNGDASSGTILDITDLDLENAEGTVENRFRFDGVMPGNIFGITYTMEDGTTKSVTNISP